MFCGLGEMTFGLVYASFRLPESQALKMTFFAPWNLSHTWAEIRNKWIVEILRKRDTFLKSTTSLEAKFRNVFE